MNLGNKIIKLRKKEKLSQENLADKLGVTRNTISNWELNITKPDILQIKKISKVFNVSIDELLDNSVRDIIEKRLCDTEKLTNKNIKITRVICVTLYCMILCVSLGIWMYYGTKKDFTDDYNPMYICTIKDDNSGNMYGLYPGDYYIYINHEFELDPLDYSIVVEFTQKDVVYPSEVYGVKYGMEFFDEIMVGSSSWMDAVDMYYKVKDRFLSDGAVCRNGIIFD